MFLDKGHASFDKLLPILLLGLLALGCLVVLQPFLTAVLWACILAYSSWPAYLRVHRTLGSRQWAAAVRGIATTSSCSPRPGSRRSCEFPRTAGPR